MKVDMKLKRYIWGGHLRRNRGNSIYLKRRGGQILSSVLPSLSSACFPHPSLHCLPSVSFPVKACIFSMRSAPMTLLKLRVASSTTFKSPSLLLLYFVPQNRKPSVLLQSLFILFLAYFLNLECELIEDRQCCLYIAYCGSPVLRTWPAME